MPNGSANTRWESSPVIPALSRDEVHMWRIAPPPVESLRQLAALLSGEERERAARFHFERDREQFCVAHGALRLLLGAYVGCPPRHLNFRAGPHGKPELAGAAGSSDVSFNLAHSHELVLVAVARGLRVGVDLEYMHTDFEFDDIARRFFSPGETAELHALSPPARRQAFFSIWARKEALLKASGEGLSRLNQVDVSVDAPVDLRPASGHPGERVHWCLVRLDVGEEYAAALAVEGPAFRLKCWDSPAALFH
jgi:4'-phosphopantetheinyl transferase